MGHGESAVAPISQKLPAVQAVHDVEPAVVEYVPAAHTVQEAREKEEPVFWNLPAGQPVTALEPTGQ